MPWLRLDDRFMENDKIVQLTNTEFRLWMRILCYCARAQDPTVDKAARREIRGAELRSIRSLIAVGLLDKVAVDNGGGPIFEVHDWAKYLTKEAQNARRQAKWRARRSNAQVTLDGVTDESHKRNASSRPPVPVVTTPTSTKEGKAEEKSSQSRGAWVEDASSYTGVRYARGEGGTSAVYDPLGKEKPPQGWTHSRPSLAEIRRALADRETVDV